MSTSLIAERRPIQDLTEPGPETESFYHLRGGSVLSLPCTGTACFIARCSRGEICGTPPVGEPRVHCWGQCFAAPAEGMDAAVPEIRGYAREPVLFRGLADPAGASLSAYTKRSRALDEALVRSPQDLLHEVSISELRGRGGAGFPTGKKWAAAGAAASGGPKHVVANADEGDPGAFSDRFLMERDPHALIEGMTLAAYAVGASSGWIYLRKEYPLAQRALQSAIQEARSAGRLGRNILGSRFDFDVEIVIGQGSYLCGEETALLASIAGKRPFVSPRPPFATKSGLHGKPTVVNNVETLACIPWIAEHGGAAYQSLGFSKSRGTKLISLNSLFRRPGLYEVEFGISAREIVEEIGGGLAAAPLKGLIIGGPLAGIIPPELLDTPFGFEELQAIGGAVGHGGILAFDERMPIISLLHHVFSFGSYESCGKCVPCSLGTARLETIFAQLASGRRGNADLQRETYLLLATLRRASLCAHGTGLAEFAESAFRHYGKELATCWE